MIEKINLKYLTQEIESQKYVDQIALYAMKEQRENCLAEILSMI